MVSYRNAYDEWRSGTLLLSEVSENQALLQVGRLSSVVRSVIRPQRRPKKYRNEKITSISQSYHASSQEEFAT